MTNIQPIIIKTSLGKLFFAHIEEISATRFHSYVADCIDPSQTLKFYSVHKNAEDAFDGVIDCANKYIKYYGDIGEINEVSNNWGANLVSKATQETKLAGIKITAN